MGERRGAEQLTSRFNEAECPEPSEGFVEEQLSTRSEWRTRDTQEAVRSERNNRHGGRGDEAGNGIAQRISYYYVLALFQQQVRQPVVSSVTYS